MSTKMKAIILAAGRSSRLYPITLEKPKCLLEVGMKRMIDWQINAIRDIGIKDIVVVVGYKGDMIKEELGDDRIRYREYTDYENTNNLHTLWSVKEELNGGLLCFFADVIFDVEIIKRAKESEEDICVIVDTSKVLEGTMNVKIEDGNLISLGSHISASEASGNFIGIAKFSDTGTKMLLEQMASMVSGHQDDYYTIAIDSLGKKGVKIGYVDVRDKMWLEIDTKEDLDNARKRYSQMRK